MLGGARDELVVRERSNMAWRFGWLIGRQIVSVCGNGTMEFALLGNSGTLGQLKQGFRGCEQQRKRSGRGKKVCIHGKLHSSRVRRRQVLSLRAI